MLFLILFFLSYLIPLFYNFIFQPILIPRYIVFVLIPIIILISSLTYKIQNIKLKKITLYLIIIFTFLNIVNEDDFKKIYDKSIKQKPEFSKVIKTIGNSPHKNFSIKFNHNELRNKKKDVLKSYNVYLEYLSRSMGYKINYYEIEKKTKEKKIIWMVCDPIINNFDCTLDPDDKIKVIKNIDFYKLNLKLIEIS